MSDRDLHARLMQVAYEAAFDDLASRASEAFRLGQIGQANLLLRLALKMTELPPPPQGRRSTGRG